MPKDPEGRLGLLCMANGLAAFMLGALNMAFLVYAAMFILAALKVQAIRRKRFYKEASHRRFLRRYDRLLSQLAAN